MFVRGEQPMNAQGKRTLTDVIKCPYCGGRLVVNSDPKLVVDGEHEGDWQPDGTVTNCEGCGELIGVLWNLSGVYKEGAFDEE